MSIFQTPEWARFKCQTGYEKFYEIDGVFVLQKKLPLGRTMLYSPMINQAQSSKFKSQNYNSKLKTLGKENKSIFYRAEFDILATSELVNWLTSNKFIKSFEEMQPEHTLILNITKSDEDILAGMKQKGRYNIKIAEKHGVQVKKSRDVSDFYQLYEQTAKRQKITYREKEYFQKLLDNLEPKGYAELFEATLRKDTITKIQDTNTEHVNAELTDCHPELACHGDMPMVSGSQQNNNEMVLASAIVSFYKNRATYLFGASSDEMRNVMAPYELHWKIIAEAKRRGCTEYDFFGIAPDDDKKHPWAGVTSFKKKFGGKQVDLLGSWDLILRSNEYRVFKILERLRRH